MILPPPRATRTDPLFPYTSLFRSKLVCILTHRDVRFAENPKQPVRELMTKDNLATVQPGASQEDARRLLHQRRIEKLLVVDRHYHFIGLIPVKDIEKAVSYPQDTKVASVRSAERRDGEEWCHQWRYRWW